MADKPQKYIIRRLDPSDFALWDHFVFETEQGTLFHTSLWAGLIRQTFQRSFEIWAVFKKDEIKGGLLFFPKKIAGIPAITQAPVTNYQGILVRSSISPKSSTIITENHDVKNLILKELKSKYNFIEFSLSTGDTDVRPYLWTGFSAEPVYTYTFPIIEPQKLQAQFSKNLRTCLNSPKRNEFIIHPSDDSQPLVKFVELSYQHHHTRPPVSGNLLLRHLTGIIQSQTGKLFYLHHHERLAAGLFVLHDERRVYAYFAGMDEMYRDIQYTKFLPAAVLEMPEFQGKIFDFLGANTPAFEPYKRSFGGELKLYFKVSYQRNRFIKLLSQLRKKQHLLKRRIKATV